MPITRLIAIALLCAATAACNLPEAGTPPGIQSLIDQRRAAIDRTRSATLRPLRVWEEEQPLSCTSPRFAQARSSVLATARLLNPEDHGIDAVIEGGDWILEVADAARDHGCKEVARHLYDTVIATYTGSAYAALRQRAEIGIEDLRQ